MSEWAFYIALYLIAGITVTEVAIWKIVPKRQSGYVYLVLLWPVPLVAGLVFIIAGLFIVILRAYVDSLKRKPR